LRFLTDLDQFCSPGRLEVVAAANFSELISTPPLTENIQN